MKRQTGLRLDTRLWTSFKELCSQAHLRPSEAVETFIKKCLEYKSITEFLASLEGLKASKEIASKIKLKKEILELEAYLAYDVKQGEAENYSNVSDCIKEIMEVMPKVADQQLISEVEEKIDKALAYYKKVFERVETPPGDIILF